MAVRIRKDKGGGSSRPDFHPGRRGSSGGGGGNPIVYFIPILLKMFSKNPKILIVILAIGAALYFFGGKSLFSGGIEQAVSALSTGCSFDAARYDATETFEPLADNVTNPLPERISLQEYAPNRLNQGSQGSCVAWASSYAARTILHSMETGKDPNQMAFSPSYLYNQIALNGCQGAYLPDAMVAMKEGGVLPFNRFLYDESSCSDKPDSREKSEARQFSIDGFNRLTENGDDHRVNMLAIKQNLAQGSPVVIGMMVGGSFMQPMEGEATWFPQEADYNMRNFGGHAMCVIGYDDYHEGGSFQLMNSWGENWGQNGLAWVRYKDFDYFVKEAYGLYPMGNASAPTTNTNDLQFTIRLQKDNSNDGKPLGLRIENKGLASSVTNVPANEDFKIEVRNTLPCYIYLFGEETDGSNYVLFPYTPKHSPYCGITGARLFPKDHSLYLDSEGEKHRFALVVSERPLNYPDLNEKMKQTASQGLAEKLEAVLGPEIWLPMKADKEGLKVSYPMNEEPVRALVVELNN